MDQVVPCSTNIWGICGVWTSNISTIWCSLVLFFGFMSPAKLHETWLRPSYGSKWLENPPLTAQMAKIRGACGSINTELGHKSTGGWGEGQLKVLASFKKQKYCWNLFIKLWVKQTYSEFDRACTSGRSLLAYHLAASNTPAMHVVLVHACKIGLAPRVALGRWSKKGYARGFKMAGPTTQVISSWCERLARWPRNTAGAL